MSTSVNELFDVSQSPVSGVSTNLECTVSPSVSVPTGLNNGIKYAGVLWDTEEILTVSTLPETEAVTPAVAYAIDA